MPAVVLSNAQRDPGGRSICMIKYEERKCTMRHKINLHANVADDPP